MPDTETRTLVEQLARRLTARGWTLACAESCTGGWLGKVLTDLPGSSAWFTASAVTYANAAKQAFLGIAPELIRTHGAVSRACALAMAEGVRQRSAAQIAVAVTGIAGPDGGTPDKPVGTVWIAVCAEGAEPQVVCHRFDGDRDAVRRQAVGAAIRGLLRLSSPN